MPPPAPHEKKKLVIKEQVIISMEKKEDLFQSDTMHLIEGMICLQYMKKSSMLMLSITKLILVQ